LTCSAPLTQLVAPLFLFDMFYSSCSTYCSIRFVEPIPLLLLDLFLKYFFVTPMILLLFVPLAQVPLYYAHDFVALCSSCSTLLLYSSCFKLVLSPPPPKKEGVEELSKYKLFFCRCGMWRSCPNSSFLGQTWKVRIFVFNFLFVDEFF
jgi:hypothetical protein